MNLLSLQDWMHALYHPMPLALVWITVFGSLSFIGLAMFAGAFRREIMVWNNRLHLRAERAKHWRSLRRQRIRVGRTTR